MATILLLPFLNKAFTIDDTLFLLEATQAINDPLHPAAFHVVWDKDVSVDGSAGILLSGPMMAYLLVPSVLRGGSEWVSRLTQLILLCGAVYGTVSLARRLGYAEHEAALAGVLVVATPAVLGMAGTSMPDVAAMSFGVLGISWYVSWIEGEQLARAAGAALLLAMAMLTRCHLLAIAPIAAIAALPAIRQANGKWKIRAIRLLAPLFLALLITGGVLASMFFTSSGARDHAASLRRFVDGCSLSSIASNGIAFHLHWLLVIPLALPWLLMHGRGLWPRIVLTISVGSVLARPATLAGFGRIAAVAVGLMVLLDIVLETYRERDVSQVLLTAWLFIGVPTVLYMHHPSKYDIAASPAVALLVTRHLRQCAPSRRRMIAIVVLVAGSALGLAIISADATLAGLGRSAAAQLIVPAVQRGERVFSAGHWGYQWYAQKAGAEQLTRSPLNATHGDMVVYSSTDESPVLESYPDRHLLFIKSYSKPGGRIMNRAARAGFFDNGFGDLPWTWSSAEIARFEVWRID